MPPVLTDLLSSKKFIFTTFVTLLVLVGWHFAFLPKEDALLFLKILWPTYLASQGIADIGAKLAQGHVDVADIHDAQNAAKDESLKNFLSTFGEAFLAAYDKSLNASKVPTADVPPPAAAPPTAPPAA